MKIVPVTAFPAVLWVVVGQWSGLESPEPLQGMEVGQMQPSAL